MAENDDQELEFIFDAYVHVRAKDWDEAMKIADIALAKLYGESGIEVETFDAYGIVDAEGNEIRPVS